MMFDFYWVKVDHNSKESSDSFMLVNPVVYQDRFYILSKIL